MESTVVSSPNRVVSEAPKIMNRVYSSGVSWGAVLAGASASAALSLTLLALGAGLGLSSISPWSNSGASESTVTTIAIIWYMAMGVISSSIGGYLSGRLRTKWTRLHADEVYFRDTAHGFLTWTVGVILTAGFLASAGTTLVGSAVSYGSTQIGTAATNSTGNEYFVDTLLRSSGQASTNASLQTEVGSIFAKALKDREVSGSDKSYLAQMITTRAGIAQSEAEKRVADTFAAAQESVDSARKAIARSLLWGFLSMLVGAFCAAFAATIGGKQRDGVPVV